MKYVLSVTFGEPAEVLLPRVPRELVAHLSRMHDFHAQGTLLMSGAFRTPGEPLSTMGVFTTQDAAQAFANGDPFIMNGIAAGWDICAWNEMVPEPSPDAPVLPIKYVLSFVTRYPSLDEAVAQAPDDIRAHTARTSEFHGRGQVLMAGALHAPEGPLKTMAIFPSRESAEEFAKGDPFVLKGMVDSWRIREWNDVLAQPPATTPGSAA
jgi:uncharacterized protein